MRPVVGSSALEPTLVHDSLLGRSRKLRARFLTPLRVAVLSEIFGDSGFGRTAAYALGDSGEARAFTFIPLRPFGDKQAGRIGQYRLGNWPYEARPPRSAEYASPVGFIEVTPENRDLHVSEHFRLGDFLTHDQQDVWPKYLVLHERLVDKLELVIDELKAQGVPVARMRVLSGFRTPQYNGRGGRGRARDSRHLWGDAADVYVDNNGDDRMDDLNRDGRVNHRDAQVILDAVTRVERAHPELAGGGGVYRATRAHGPFAHIDARGSRARWRRA